LIATLSVCRYITLIVPYTPLAGLSDSVRCRLRSASFYPINNFFYIITAENGEEGFSTGR